MLRISSTTNLSGYPKDDIYEYIKNEIAFQKRMGFDAMDFSMSLLKDFGDDWRAIIEYAIECSEIENIRFEVCHLPFTVKMYDDMSLYREFDKSVHNAIDAAVLLGVKYAVMHPTTITVPRVSFVEKEKYDFVMRHLSPFAEHAVRVGVNLALENMGPIPASYPVHRYCQEPDELCRLSDSLGVGVCWDFGHAHIAGISQSEAIKYIGTRLKVLHVNDNLASGDHHLPPFLGTIDWRDAMNGLCEIGFSGLFNYEISTANLPITMREPFAKYLLASAKAILSYK